MLTLYIFLAAALLFFAAIPFGLYQLTLLALPAYKQHQVTRDKTDKQIPSCSLLLCAYNEEKVIEEKILNMLQLKSVASPLDIFLYIDGASDKTAEIAERYADEINIVQSSSRKGKPWGMNQLMAKVTTDVAVFTDANVHIDKNAIVNLTRYFQDPEIGCVTSTLQYTNTDESETASVGGLYWKLDNWTKNLETRTGSAMGADGSLFAIRSKLYTHCPAHVIDDFHTSIAVLCQGYRVISADDVKAYELHTSVAKDEFGRKVRIACQCLAAHSTLWLRVKKLPTLDLYKYICHRYLRWMSGFCLLGSTFFVLCALSVVIGGLSALYSLFGLLLFFAVLVKLSVKPFPALYNVIAAFAGTSIGVLRYYFGSPVVTWDLAESARSN